MGKQVYGILILGLIIGTATVALARGGKAKRPKVVGAKATRWKRPPLAELEKRLSPLQLQVTQHEGTERPFQNAYWDHHQAGIYVDIVSGEPLFSSKDKFDSGTGWPSFTRPLVTAHVIEKRDVTAGMVRVEVRSKFADSHLGHVFDDGPAPAGLRYCINSASLRFVPAAELSRQGYPEYARGFAVSSRP